MYIGYAYAYIRFTQGFFDHGIDVMNKFKIMKINDISGLFAIEWE